MQMQQQAKKLCPADERLSNNSIKFKIWITSTANYLSFIVTSYKNKRMSWTFYLAFFNGLVLLQINFPVLHCCRCLDNKNSKFLFWRNIMMLLSQNALELLYNVGSVILIDPFKAMWLLAFACLKTVIKFGD